MCPTLGHFEDARVFHVRFHRQQLHAERAAVVPSFGPGRLIIIISLYFLEEKGAHLEEGKEKVSTAGSIPVSEGKHIYKCMVKNRFSIEWHFCYFGGFRCWRSSGPPENLRQECFVKREFRTLKSPTSLVHLAGHEAWTALGGATFTYADNREGLSHQLCPELVSLPGRRRCTCPCTPCR